jgi:hypothetical protein
MTIHFILSAMFFSAIAGAISGRIYTRFVPDLEYQLVPTWFFAGALSSFIASAVGCGIILIFDSHIIENFYQLLAITIIASELLLFWIMYKSVTNK